MIKFPGVSVAAALLLSCLLLGCVLSASNELAARSADAIITFPQPMGDWIIPLEIHPTYYYQFTELDGESKIQATHSQLPLYIRDKGEGMYGFSYETPDSGLLMIQIPGRDSAAGIYIVGRFVRENILLQDAVLWLQQFPRKDIVRQLGPDWTVTCVDTGAVYYSKVDIEGENISQGEEMPMYKYTTILFREKLGEREFNYYLRKGIGILGMEEVVDGKTVAIGALDHIHLGRDYVPASSEENRYFR